MATLLEQRLGIQWRLFNNMSRLFPTYARWDVEIEHANGTKVIDKNGKSYLDFVSGIAVCNLGHCHGAVLAAVQKQLEKVWHVSNLFENSLQEEVATKLVNHSCGEAVFFCNSGAEANEAAIKLARKYTNKSKIITFQQSFHGRTLGTMAATGQEKVKQGFGPMLETFVHIPYNDVETLKQTIDHETAAVMLEVIQGEGGVHLGNRAFIEAAAALCKQYGALLIIDEVQTGIGRTGKPFAYQHFDISPDIITVAKGLGSGFPVGAMIGKKVLTTAFQAGSHGSTFGGNPLAMTAANATLEIIFDEAFLAEVEEKGAYFSAQLQDICSDVNGFQAIRGKGLLIGAAFDFETTSIIQTLRENGLLVLNAGPHVIRFLPPLTVLKAEIDAAVQIVKEVVQTKRILY